MKIYISSASSANATNVKTNEGSKKSEFHDKDQREKKYNEERMKLQNEALKKQIVIIYIVNLVG